MKCFIGIDLGSTTTKAVVMDEARTVLGRGITNSRSNYDTAAAVAKQEALLAARFFLFRRELEKRFSLTISHRYTQTNGFVWNINPKITQHALLIC